MSSLRNSNSGVRMCSMFFSEPVSRLSTQMTWCPRRRSSSHRCDPRKPAPPVTRQVPIALRLSVVHRIRRELPRARGLQLLLRDLRGDDDEAVLAALGEAADDQPLRDDGAALAARIALAAALLRLDDALLHPDRRSTFAIRAA